MSDELLNILNNSNKDIDNQKIMDYLSNKLSAEEKHLLEEEMLDSELMNDAVEGLSEFQNKKNAALFAEELNRQLKKQLKKKKSEKRKKKIERYVVAVFFNCNDIADNHCELFCYQTFDINLFKILVSNFSTILKIHFQNSLNPLTLLYPKLDLQKIVSSATKSAQSSLQN